MKIGFLSDLHITQNTNMIEQAVNSVAEACHNEGVEMLFIAGDTTESAVKTLEFVDMLVDKGLDTYTIFGNHEYWGMTYEETQSIDNDRYIHGKSILVGDDTVVIGVDGFFDYSFVLNVDNEFTKPLPKDKRVLNQYGRNNFDLKKNKIGNYSEVFDIMEASLIEQLNKNIDKDIILMTHYVPSKEFILYNDDVAWCINNSFMGSTRYQELAEEYKVSKVIFGHTHTKYNTSINGVDYHCNPIGYSRFEYEGIFRDRVRDRLKVFEV